VGGESLLIFDRHSGENARLRSANAPLMMPNERLI
jgi:hypothetical protein